LLKKTLEVLEEYSSVSSIKAILFDNTATNTGYKTGLGVSLEKLLGYSVHTIGCSLHWIELPLRSMTKLVDGSTSGPKTFTGPIGKVLSDDYHRKDVVNFEVLPADQGTPFHVDIDDLSEDQRCLVEYYQAVTTGQVSSKWLLRRIRGINHARWLTRAARILSLYENFKSLQRAQVVGQVHYLYLCTWMVYDKVCEASSDPSNHSSSDEDHETQVRGQIVRSFLLLHANQLLCPPEAKLFVSDGFRRRSSGKNRFFAVYIRV